MATQRASASLRASFALSTLLLLLGNALPRLVHGQVTCLSLAANTLSDGEITPSFPRTGDTSRVQRALDGCRAGQVLELSGLSGLSGAGRGDFFVGPLHIPPDVTLKLAPGVELHASSPDLSVPMIDAAPGAAVLGPGVIEAQPGDTESDLIRSNGSLWLVDLTLRAAPGISVHHLTTGSLRLEGVSIVSLTQPLAIDSPSTIVTIYDSTFAGSLTPLLPEDTALSRVSSYAGNPGGNRCQLNTPSNCIAADLPAILTHLEVSPDHILSAIFTPAELATPSPTGLVDFAMDGIFFASAPIFGYAASTPLPVLPAGRHLFTAETHDGSLHLRGVGLDGPRPRLESNTITALSTAMARVPYGTTVVLSVSIRPESATGSVTLTDSAQPLSTLVLSSGGATFTSNSFAPGTHTITATYSGDPNDASSQSPPLTLVVLPDSTHLQLSALPAAAPFGSLPQLNVSIMPNAATGLIRLHDLASSAVTDMALSNGAASFSLATLPIGSHTLSVTYAGDANDAPSASFSTTTVVTLIPTIITLAPISGSVSYGTAITLTAQLSPAGAGGTVTFTDSVTGQFALVPAASATDTIVRGLSTGLHNLQATYSGDATHAAAVSQIASVNIVSRTTSTILAPIPTTLTAGSALLLSASVFPASATGTVIFRDTASGIIGSASLTTGIATFPASALLPGAHALTASYIGDANNLPSTSPQQALAILLHATTLQFVSLQATSVFGAPETLSTTLLPSTATGTVIFRDGGTILGSVVVAEGLASLVLPQLALGSHTFAAAYSGDGWNSPAATPGLSVRIVPDPTLTTLILAANPTVVGTPVTINILVSAPYTTSGGSVILRSGSQILGSGVIRNAIQGKGSLTLVFATTNLFPGTYPISASYLGDPANLPSDSLPTNQTFTIIPKPVMGSLTVSANPVAAGEPVTVTAVMTSSSSPAGRITFAANGSPVATVTLDANGHASATLPALPPGSWVVAATFAASAPFTSTPLAPLILSVQTPFTIAVAPGTLPLAPAASGNSSLTMTPLFGFSGPVLVACLPAVSFIHCTPASQSVTLSGNSPATTTVHLAVGATTISRRRLPTPVIFLSALAPVLLFKRKCQRRLFHLTLLCLCLVAGGCGAGYFDTIVPGPYLVAVSVSVPGYSALQTITVTVP